MTLGKTISTHCEVHLAFPFFSGFLGAWERIRRCQPIGGPPVEADGEDGFSDAGAEQDSGTREEPPLLLPFVLQSVRLRFIYCAVPELQEKTWPSRQRAVDGRLQ